MAATLKLECGGCDAKAETDFVRRSFHSFSGRGYGFGRYVAPDLEKLAADIGWTLWDGIGCTYCPKCTELLDIAARDAASSKHDDLGSYREQMTDGGRGHLLRDTD